MAASAPLKSKTVVGPALIPLGHHEGKPPIPLLRPVILVAVALRTIGAFKVFDIIYVLTGNGGPANSTKVIAFYDYDQAFHYLFFGYGAAISWLITAFMLVMIVIYIRLLQSDVGA